MQGDPRLSESVMAPVHTMHRVTGSPEWHVATRSDGTSRTSVPPRRLRVMRVVTPAEAVSVIRSGDQIYLHCAAATPSVLLDALVARAEELHDVSIVHL